MKIFISPGNESHLARISDYLNDTICGILLHQPIDKPKLLMSLQNVEDFHDRIFTFNSLLEPITERLDAQDLVAYKCWLDHIFSDTRVHYLATRSYLNSPFNNAVIIEKILVNSILIIRKTNPSCLISSATPHCIEAWVFAKCFEYLNLPVYILESTPIVFRLWVRRGLDEQEIVLRTGGGAGKNLTTASLNLLREQRESKPGAKDQSGFDIARMHMSSVAGSQSNKWWSWSREIRRLRFGRVRSLPLRLLSIYLKRRLYKSYCDVAIKELPQRPFVVFFMHYQPERTSLPEGLFYVQQWIAVRMLAWSLPQGWSLLVREHPTMWLDPLDVSVRTMSLYEELSSLEGTKICSMDIDTFDLIDECQAVATLTGSVGFQSLLRDKPVLAFGVASYKDHPACFSVESYSDLVSAFGAIQEDNISDHFTDDAIKNYLLWVEQNSISADPEETDRLEARLKNFAEVYRQVLYGELKLQ